VPFSDSRSCPSFFCKIILYSCRHKMEFFFDLNSIVYKLCFFSANPWVHVTLKNSFRALFFFLNVFILSIKKWSCFCNFKKGKKFRSRKKTNDFNIILLPHPILKEQKKTEHFGQFPISSRKYLSPVKPLCCKRATKRRKKKLTFFFFQEVLVLNRFVLKPFAKKKVFF